MKTEYSLSTDEDGEMRVKAQNKAPKWIKNTYFFSYL